MAHLPATTRFPREHQPEENSFQKLKKCKYIFLFYVGSICLKQLHIHEELGPFALGKSQVLFSSRKLRKLG
jgi:hypothetical protein